MATLDYAAACEVDPGVAPWHPRIRIEEAPLSVDRCRSRYLEGIARGELPPPPSFVFRQVAGRRLGDCPFNSLFVPLIISDRFRQVLERCQATGWSAVPAEVHQRDGTLAPGYSALIVHGRCGAVQEERGIEEVRPPHREGLPEWHVWVGLFFEDDYWDGSDVFTPLTTPNRPNVYRTVLVSGRVADALRRAKLKGFDLKPCSERERTWPLRKPESPQQST